uniref:Uncharacterized protein n=1 Tax=Anguilla anguilla TaxID=7936 RepID=A0A0E9X8F8_ANGAN
MSYIASTFLQRPRSICSFTEIILKCNSKRAFLASHIFTAQYSHHIFARELHVKTQLRISALHMRQRLLDITVNTQLPVYTIGKYHQDLKLPRNYLRSYIATHVLEKCFFSR